MPATPPTPSCRSDIIDVLAHQPAGFITSQVLEYADFRKNWWYMRPNKTPYPMHTGPAPVRRVASRQRGGEIYPFRAWGPSNGSGSAADNQLAGQPIGTPARNACCPPIVPLTRGYENKGISTFDLGFGSRDFCSKDFTQSANPAGDLAFEYRQYGMQVENAVATMQRNEYIRLSQVKIVDTPGNGLFRRHATSGTGDPTQQMAAAAWAAYQAGVNPTPTDPSTGITGTAQSMALYLGIDTSVVPTSKLNQDLLTKIAQWENGEGVDGITTMNGAQIYEIVSDTVTNDNLLRDVTNKDNFLYADMGKGEEARLLGGLGQSIQYRDFVYRADPYPLRFDINWNVIPATIPIQVDSGVKYITNPAWYNAAITTSIIYIDEVYDICYPEVAAAPGGNVQFLPYTYAGDFKFVLHPTDVSPLQNTGYFFSELFVGSWPGRNDHGVVVFHLNCNAGAFEDCNNIITTY